MVPQKQISDKMKISFLHFHSHCRRHRRSKIAESSLQKATWQSCSCHSWSGSRISSFASENVYDWKVDHHTRWIRSQICREPQWGLQWRQRKSKCEQRWWKDWQKERALASVGLTGSDRAIRSHPLARCSRTGWLRTRGLDCIWWWRGWRRTRLRRWQPTKCCQLFPAAFLQ